MTNSQYVSSLRRFPKNQVDAAGLDVAKEAALGAIIDPVSLFNYQRNMLSLPAIQALAKNNCE